MLKIDVNKSGKIFDFLVSSGMLILAYDPTVKPVYPPPKEMSGLHSAPLSVDLVNGHTTNGISNGHSGGKDANVTLGTPLTSNINVNGH